MTRSNWTNYAIVGLRDPLAADPDELVQQYGIDPVKVESRWEPYSSLDPAFSIARSLLNSKDAIEQQVIRFSLNSAKLEAPEIVQIDTIQAQLLSLQRQATDESHKVMLQVVGGGTGLGPSISKKFVEVMGGTFGLKVLSATAARSISPRHLRSVKNRLQPGAMSRRKQN